MRARSSIFTGSPMSSTNTSPPLRHGAGLDHELGRLRDRHEVADHLGMRDRHRAPRLDLPAEAPHHGARAESSTLPKRTMVKMVSPRRHPRRGGLQEQLGKPLARTHDAGRAHRLVARDQHEALDAGALGTGDDRSAEGVVPQPLARVQLHDRHMLVGCRVIDRLHPVAADHVGDTLCVEHAAEHRYDLDLSASVSAGPAYRGDLAPDLG